jgi:uncharacterized protein (TIGR02145 family)
LPGGYRYSMGVFSDIGDYGDWWSSTESNTLLAYYREMYHYNGSLDSYSNPKGLGLSVRCLRD